MRTNRLHTIIKEKEKEQIKNKDSNKTTCNNYISYLQNKLHAWLTSAWEVAAGKHGVRVFILARPRSKRKGDKVIDREREVPTNAS